MQTTTRLNENFCCTEFKAQLYSTALPAGPHVREDKKFFPASQLRQFFTPTVAEQLLACACDKCSRHRDGTNLSDRQLRDAATRIARGCGQSKGERLDAYHTILGLMLYVETPALTLAFSNQRCSDSLVRGLLGGLSESQLRDRFWPKLLSQDVALYTASCVLRHRFRFFLPFLKAGDYTEYDENVILPFINEEKIGMTDIDGNIQSEGNFGDIYGFNIAQGYHNFTTPDLVRKELSGPNTFLYKAERENLNRVNKIKDEHIVEVLLAYKHGDKCNIVFPRAKANLGNYLRDVRYGALDVTHTRLEHHPFWTQVDGLARALAKILNYETGDKHRFDFGYGYHLDLKPANVLVFDDLVFVISDFGQAHFKRTHASGSNVEGRAGTESYAPPEYHNEKLRINRKYDIWSLGCIFLEIATFIILGHDGVRELDSRRTTRSEDRTEVNDRFVEPYSGGWRLKPPIAAWMDHLLQQVTSESGRNFMEEFMGLVRRMLAARIEDRCDYRYVCWRLSEILSSRRFSTAATPDAVLDNVQNVPTITSWSSAVGSEAISCTVNLKYHQKDSWRSGSVKLARTHRHLKLSAFDHSSKTWLSILSGDVRFLRLVPLYALRDDSDHKSKGSSLQLHDSTRSDGSPVPCDQFFFESLTDARDFQEALLGQKVLHHVEVTEVSIQHPPVSAGRFPVFGERLKCKPADTLDEARPILQLWSDGYRISRKTEPGSRAPERASTQTSFRPPTQRVAIFSKDRIHLVCINERLRMAKDNEEDLRSNVIHLYAAGNGTNRTFDCLTKSKMSNTEWPSIPLSNQSLEFEEYRQSWSVSSMRLTFKSPDHRESFKAMYKKLKYNWEISQKQCIEGQDRNEMGMKLGYAPNTH